MKARAQRPATSRRMKCKDCGRPMTLVMAERSTGRWYDCKGEVIESAWVCVSTPGCRQHCVSGPMHSEPVWHPALSLTPDSKCHAAIWGALRALDAVK